MKPQDLMELKKVHLDPVSRSFCTAKWLHSTIYLQNGYTHSCYHPPAQKIDLAELEQKGALAFHNSQHKIDQRKQMLAGAQPEECSLCWKVESAGQDLVSERLYHSLDSDWSLPYLEDLQKRNLENQVPRYLEISFDNKCNLRCMYCSQESSSSWDKELLEFGLYPTDPPAGLVSKKRMATAGENPYRQKFLEDWPAIYRDLKVLRITGGEPLLSLDTWKVFEHILANPRPDLSLVVNSNFSLPSVTIEKFINFVNQSRRNVKDVVLVSSAEAWGPQCEFIRFGMDFPLFWENIQKFLKETNSKLSITASLNVLSYKNFDILVSKMNELKMIYGSRINLKIAIVRWPEFLDGALLPSIIKDDFFRKSYRVLENSFGELSINQLRRVEHFWRRPLGKEWEQKQRKNFIHFFQEYDRRKQTSFLENFPELREFWGECLLEKIC